MRRFLTLFPMLCLSAPVLAQAPAPKAPLASVAATTWGPAPAILPAGARFAVIDGDPGQPGEYTIRLLLPDGYRIAPHHHPTNEHVTVIKGTFHIGMGDAVRREGALALRTGGFATAHAGQPHFAWAEGETIVQVHGMGPFQLVYVNPADVPGKAR